MKNQVKYLAKLSVLALLVQGLWSCNKDFENKYKFVNTKDTTLAVSSNKVLYVILTGARGTSLEKLATPTLSDIKDHANYSFQSVSDASGLNAVTWTDMLTGVDKLKHRVTSEDFVGNKLADFPMFFKRVKQQTNLRTAAFTSSTALSTKLVSDANVNQLSADDDQATKNTALAELSKDDAGVVLVEFNSADKAGTQYGYDAGIPQYASALQNLDTYVAELMAKLKSRDNYQNENWLVVIASNKGGDFPVPPYENDGTLFSKPLLNSYVMFYNPKFRNLVYEKPNTDALSYEGSAVDLTGTTTRAVLAGNNADIFNFGKDINQEYTLEFKIKVNTFGSGSAEILSKNANPYGGNDGYSGWWIIQNGAGGTWRFGGSGGGLTIATSGLAPKLETGIWYNIGFKIYKENGKRWVKLYQEGEPASAAVDVTSKNFVNTANLTAGFLGGNGSSADLNITDLRLFKTAVPDAVLKEYACQFDVPDTHPNYTDLIGYWSGIDGAGNMYKDRITGNRNFVIGGSPSWEAFKSDDPKFCIPLPSDVYRKQPNGVDIPKYIFSWLKIRTNGFNLDSKTWLPAYGALQP